MIQFQTIRDTLTRIESYGFWTVLIEMSLIALVVWWAVRFLRGTRGARLVKGAALVLAVVYIVIQLLPRAERWDRLQFLYTRFLFFAVVAAVVVFQPELRRALMQLGQARFFRAQATRTEAMIQQLCASAAYLARNKIGALIALERSVGLGTLIENGTPVDSELTSDLLNTIFYPGSALHDMGVVVQQGRLAAAGVQFPLAETGEIDRSLGSRHRAALGLSEESDAVIIVVSEETGRVSVAYDGQLSVGVEPDRLRDMLHELMNPGGPRWTRRGHGKEPLKLWPPRLPEARKVLAAGQTLAWVVLVTALVWVWADLERTDEATGQKIVLHLSVPTPVDRGLLIESPKEDIEVTFGCTGPQATLSKLVRKLNEVKPTLVVQPKNWTPGVNPVNVLDRLNEWLLLNWPGVTAHTADPAEVAVTADRWVLRKAKVEFKYTGEVLLDPAVTSVSPETVDVLVPESRLGQVENLRVSTTPLNLAPYPVGEGRTEPGVRLATEIDGIPIRSSPSSVRVTFSRQGSIDSKTVSVSVGMLTPGLLAERIASEGYQLERKNPEQWQQDITVTGAREELDKLKAGMVRAYVQVADNDLVNSETLPLSHDVTVVLPPNLPSLKLQENGPLPVTFRYIQPAPTTVPATMP